jgi:class I fructose-bisphosphate aldolase
MFALAEQAHNLGAAGVGATIYFGSKNSNRQIEEVSYAFARAHELGMFTVLWCYPRNEYFQQEEQNYERAADITSQACYLGATIEADIVKQKLPECLDGFRKLNFSKYNDAMYENLAGQHPIDWVRLQVANSYMGKINLLNSGGASGENDTSQAVRSAVINKRGGGAGLIMGRKAFSKPFKDGVEILNAVQDVYLESKVSLA